MPLGILLKEKGVTVITINSNPTTDNVFLPHVLQDRKPRAHSGSHASTLNEPEISFSTLNQGRNVKTSSSSTNSGEVSDKKLESVNKKVFNEKQNFSENQKVSGDIDGRQSSDSHHRISSDIETQNTATSEGKKI